MAPKTDLPGWFPFAVTASFLVMVGAGIRANWKTSQAAPKPPVKQAGMLQEWAGVRWNS